MEHIDSIINYIEYLKTEKKFSVTIHIHSFPKPFGMHGLKKYNTHNNPYCAFLKQTAEARWRCLKCQRKTVEKCSREGAFSGICHAGVFEYVYPVTINGKVLGIVSVGGYGASSSNEYISRISSKYLIDERALAATYQSLNTNIPEKEVVDTLIAPLLSMLELFTYKSGLNIAVRQSLFDRILEYIRNTYTQKITTELLCDRFYCSRSYIAHAFKKETGKSLPEYVNELRIESAKDMLENSTISVAEIASIVGFEERSYFSKCFTKATGVSPKQWRQKYKI